MHAPGRTVNYLLPICYAGGDLAMLGIGDDPKFRDRYDAVAAAMYVFVDERRTPRRMSDWYGADVLVVRDVQGGVGDQILFGQVLHGLVREGAKLYGVFATPKYGEPRPVSLEAQKLYWPDFKDLDIEQFKGAAALEEMKRFARVVAALKVPAKLAATYPSWAHACGINFGVKPKRKPPAMLADGILAARGWPARYLVAHLGAKTHRYADAAALAFAQETAKQSDLPLIVIGSPGMLLPDGVVDARRLPFSDQAAIISAAVGGIGPDSAGAHVAGVAGVRYVVVVDPAVAWLSEFGIAPTYFTGHYPGVAYAPAPPEPVE